MNTPTYDMKQIEANPEWYLAYVISQIKDDDAPIKWGQHLCLAGCLLDNFDIKPKRKTTKGKQ